MNSESVHNPDRFMADLRQILSQGRKRIGLLIGAGAPASISVNENNQIVEEPWRPLIPDVDGLTTGVIESLDSGSSATIQTLRAEFPNLNNIEDILTQIRKLAQAIGTAEVFGLTGPQYNDLAQEICDLIGSIVNKSLPDPPTPYSHLVAWIAGTQREHPVEIFTPNYDLLIESAFETARVPYFDGFTGSRLPFFDPAAVSSDSLPPRWSLLWKLHGSLGWKIVDDRLVRTGDATATELIYPDHLKYDQATRPPYSAMFERLRRFLTAPDTLLMSTGFSFADSHIEKVLDESLAANAHTAVLAFQFKPLIEEGLARTLALSRPNMSVYARDGAIINGVAGKWQTGAPPNEEWENIRRTFWGHAGDGEPNFLLGDFAKLTRFLALIQAEDIFEAERQSAETSDEQPDAGQTSDD